MSEFDTGCDCAEETASGCCCVGSCWFSSAHSISSFLPQDDEKKTATAPHWALTLNCPENASHNVDCSHLNNLHILMMSSAVLPTRQFSHLLWESCDIFYIYSQYLLFRAQICQLCFSICFVLFLVSLVVIFLKGTGAVDDAFSCLWKYFELTPWKTSLWLTLQPFQEAGVQLKNKVNIWGGSSGGRSIEILYFAIENDSITRTSSMKVDLNHPASLFSTHSAFKSEVFAKSNLLKYQLSSDPVLEFNLQPGLI